jgi:hypothetical protein
LPAAVVDGGFTQVSRGWPCQLNSLAIKSMWRAIKLIYVENVMNATLPSF